MIFVDTSAVYAILDSTDENHSRARATWFRLLDSETPLVTSNYILVESCALSQHRLGMKAVRSVYDDILPVITIHWIDKVIHAMAVSALLTANRTKLSLVDCSSFVLMRQLDVRKAFAFDAHFTQEGFAFPED